jgi:hypothetical protein
MEARCNDRARVRESDDCESGEDESRLRKRCGSQNLRE